MHMVTRRTPYYAISSLMLINEDLRLLKRIVLYGPLFHLIPRPSANLNIHKHHVSGNDKCINGRSRAPSTLPELVGIELLRGTPE